MKLPVPLEEEVQQDCIKLAAVFGFTAMQTTVRKKKIQCPNPFCLKWFRPKGGYGSSFGVPDLIIHHPKMPQGFALLVEVKRAGTIKWTNPEQQRLHESGRTYVVQDTKQLEAILRAVKELDYREGPPTDFYKEGKGNQK